MDERKVNRRSDLIKKGKLLIAKAMRGWSRGLIMSLEITSTSIFNFFFFCTNQESVRFLICVLETITQAYHEESALKSRFLLKICSTKQTIFVIHTILRSP
ncbi:hypothetical protein ACOSP7_014760 [Xanthoceras sorbifolium]